MFEGLLQPMHLLILLGIVLLVFGPKKLPELGKGMGEALRGFKQAMSETESEQKRLVISKNRAELEIQQLQEKINELRNRDWIAPIEMQQRQIDLLERLLPEADARTDQVLNG